MIPVSNQLKQQFNTVLSHSQNIDYDLINTASLFEDFATNKYDIYKRFGNKLIVEIPNMEIMLTEEDKREQIKSLIDLAGNLSSEMADFLKLNQDSIYDNKVSVSYYVATTNEHIPVGMKLGKALKFFTCLDSDVDITPEDIAYVQNQLANIIQSNKMVGTLCFSIHPLDFLSLSENNHNWRSCHALDGEYRAGNLSYMADNCTIITYLKSPEDTKLPRFPAEVPWNSKKWRCLLFFDFDRGLVHAGRQYPTFNRAMLDALREWCPIATARYGCWNHNVFSAFEANNTLYNLSERYIAYHGKILPYSYFVADTTEAVHYNDLLNSSCYRPYTIELSEGSICEQASSIIVGTPVTCVICGEQLICDSDCVACKDCAIEYDIPSDSLTQCERCGQTCLTIECHEHCGDILCQQCYDEIVDY